MDSAPAAPSEAQDETVVRSAALKFEGILDRLIGGGVLFDRALLCELSSFLEYEGWPAVAANERLVTAAAAGAWAPAS